MKTSKITRPKKPTEPKRPENPTKDKIIFNNLNLGYDFTLAKLLESLPKNINPNDVVIRERNEHCYECGGGDIDIEYITKSENINYKFECELYKKKLEIYEEKMKMYNEQFNKYQKELVIYKKQKETEIITKMEKKLKELKDEL